MHDKKEHFNTGLFKSWILWNAVKPTVTPKETILFYDD